MERGLPSLLRAIGQLLNIRSGEIRLRRLKLRLRNNALLTTRTPALPSDNNRFSCSWFFGSVLPQIRDDDEDDNNNNNSGATTYDESNFTSRLLNSCPHHCFWTQSKNIQTGLHPVVTDFKRIMLLKYRFQNSSRRYCTQAYCRLIPVPIPSEFPFIKYLSLRRLKLARFLYKWAEVGLLLNDVH